MYSSGKKTIKSSQIAKNGPQIVKNENFQKQFFWLFLCHIEPTSQQFCLWPIQRQGGKKLPRYVKNENFGKPFFPQP